MRSAVIAAMLLAPLSAHAQQAGDAYEIERDYQTAQHDNGGSSGSTGDQDGFVERVIAVRDGGVELEYDITNAGDRSSQWHFPLRVFKPAHGPLKLVNAAELEARIDPWLAGGGMTRAACGRWIFTWNAFRIDCDPQSVLQTIEQLQLDPGDLREGAAFKVPGAHEAAHLVRKSDRRYSADLALDPEKVRTSLADRDVTLAKLSGQTLTAESARRKHADEAISGTISVTFDLDATGHVARRTTVTRQEIRSADGKIETTIATEILTRRPIPKPPRDPNLI